MSGHRTRNIRSKRQGPFWLRLTSRSKTGGQALIEYVLILTLVVIALIAVLAITGPAVGNVFSNQVYNLLGGTLAPRNTLSADQFWDQVAAVASYTPENPVLMTNTPAPATAVPTEGPSATPEPDGDGDGVPDKTDKCPTVYGEVIYKGCPPPTPGPSPTPEDVEHDFPFDDPGDNPDWWKHDQNNPLKNSTWNAEYWDFPGSPGSTILSNMNGLTDGSGKYRTTMSDIDFSLGDGVSPGGGVKSDFYARFKTTGTFEAKEYMVRIYKDAAVRVWVGGTLIVDANVPNAGDAATWTSTCTPLCNTWFERRFTAAKGDLPVVVEFADNGGAAALKVYFSAPNEDQGDCNWTLDDLDGIYHSAPSAWSDSPGLNVNYSPNSFCVLVLRGYIDLTTATNPKMEFWDRFSLDAYAYAKVGLAEAGTNNWADYTLHYNGTNLGWMRQTFDLTQFDPDGAAPPVNFAGKLVEIRFVLDAREASTTLDGWWIDDIKVNQDPLKRYTIPFSDDMDADEIHWYAGGTWARSTEQNPHSGRYAWSDSPGKTYIHGSDSTLELDGIVDIPAAGGIPEAVFWHKYDLVETDAIYFEISTDRVTWNPLGGGPLVPAQTSNLTWTRKVLSLEGLEGQSVYMRFRLDALSDTRVGDGWWIDDFSLRFRPTSTVILNWCDTMEGGGTNWINNSKWAIVNGPDANVITGQTVSPLSGTRFWSDSPRADYFPSTSNVLELSPSVELTTATNPEVVFWHQRDLGTSENLYAEVSQNDGETWTTVWSYQDGSLPMGYGTVPDHGHSHILTWTRESASLSSVKGSPVRFRFRLESQSDGSVDDGWWIDDVCFQERVTPVAHVLSSGPFNEKFETTLQNWYVNGLWGTTTDTYRSTSTYAATDSPGRDYAHESNSTMELKTPIDLTGTVKPTLYFWDKFNLNYDDYALVEISTSTDAGQTWGSWNSIYGYLAVTTASWDRRQVDLTDYIGRWIRIRFRVYSVLDGATADGWYIDDLSVVDRNGAEPTFSLPFRDNAEATNSYWVNDHTWGKATTWQPIGSGAGLGTGSWIAEYYSDYLKVRDFSKAQLMGTRLETEIYWDWGSGRPSGVSLPSDDNFMVRWTRTITVPASTQYQIHTASDDGIRVRVDGTQVINVWSGRSFPSIPDVATVTLAAGSHTIIVEYYEDGGSAGAYVNFLTPNGKVFQESPVGNYGHLVDMSMTLEGVIDLTGSSSPRLSYWEKRVMGDGIDTLYTEISTDGGFTWTRLRSKTGSDQVWKRVEISLNSYKTKQINIRFRVDTRNADTRSNDGWFINDIEVADF